jgi:NADPH-dependent 2,4-dienoyl-CoA reductase/sulfur reductase-like enzyme
LDDALTLRDGLRSARRVAVVGAGVLGSEIASAARKHDVDALLLGRSGALTFGGVGTLLSSRLAGLHEDHGVELDLRAEIVSAEPSRGGIAIELAEGRIELVDRVVATIGATPRTRWLDSSSLTIADGVVCDRVGRAAPGVWAVGDVAAWEDSVTGLPERVEHQGNAIEQAIAVALQIVHGELGSQPVPLFWSEVHGTRIHAYGWFDPERPLVATDDTDADATDSAVLLSRDAAGQVRGAVGWNAPPRDFRTARAAVLSAPVLTAH